MDRNDDFKILDTYCDYLSIITPLAIDREFMLTHWSPNCPVQFNFKGIYEDPLIVE